MLPFCFSEMEVEDKKYLLGEHLKFYSASVVSLTCTMEMLWSYQLFLYFILHQKHQEKYWKPCCRFYKNE